MKLTYKKMSLMVAAVFGVIGIGTVVTTLAAPQTVWYTGFESNQPKLSYSDTVDWATNIGPHPNANKPEASVRQEVAFAGKKALMYSGKDQSSGGSYVYFKSFDVSIPVTSDMSFSYQLYPQNTNARCVSVDLQFSDGSTLRDSPVKDSKDVSMHPNACHGGQIPLNKWSQVSGKLGQHFAGRTVTKIWVAYDQPANTGTFRGYIDDIRFTRDIPITSPSSSTYKAEYWNYKDTPRIPVGISAYARQEQTVSHDWRGGSPHNNVNTDRFVARWTKKQRFEAGNYVFKVAADDGVRLYVDDKLVLDKWIDQSYKTYDVTTTIASGERIIRLEYYEKAGDARVEMSYSKTLASTPAPAPTTPKPSPAPSPAPVPMPPAPSGNALNGVRLFNDTANDPATAQVNAWANSRPDDATQIRKIAIQPRGKWLGGWSGDIRAATNDVVSRAAAQGSVPVLVAYNIPFRDCGQYSAGGLGSSSEYIKWITDMANGINGRKAVVILEPDALGLLNCLSEADKQARFAMLSRAVTVLESKGGLVYIEASTWIDPSSMAQLLRQSNVANATGFSLNVSGFNSTADMTSYGNEVSKLLSGAHYVIDTSRNGNGSSGEWCNPSGRALGATPRTFSSGALDAYLWIKTPGESDGTCNGGPDAGQWWSSYALGLAERAR